MRRKAGKGDCFGGDFNKPARKSSLRWKEIYGDSCVSLNFKTNLDSQENSLLFDENGFETDITAVFSL